MIRKFRSLLTDVLSDDAPHAPSPTSKDADGGAPPLQATQAAVIQRMLDDDGVSPTEAMLMTDLDRDEFMLQIVRLRGGRVRQKQLVEWTDWSASTVSRSLSEMEAQNRIERVQLGRGNLVLLPDSRHDTEA